MAYDTAITPEEMRAIEARAERLGVTRLQLMENAGKGVADFIARMDPAGMKVVVVAGTGNNGGDGFVVARHMAAYESLVKVFLLGRDEEVKTAEAAHNLRILRQMRGSVELVTLAGADFMERLGKALAEADVIVDAIFGTGIKGQLREPHASVIDMINRSRAYRLAVDVPSGLDPLTGEVCGRAVRANATLTFHRPKKGLLLRGDLVGELLVVNIGIPPEADVGGGDEAGR
ncbi:MAG: NAD(P)H-hydrate epimerase [Candidatus Hadarchaeum sp.]|uniref:NAD(P)H-hydrate epimerase n=1 Tax=Candidatus Hadarchaeum sp. TaxID=2883567 RepID=UPI003D0B0C40